VSVTMRGSDERTAQNHASGQMRTAGVAPNKTVSMTSVGVGWTSASTRSADGEANKSDSVRSEDAAVTTSASARSEDAAEMKAGAKKEGTGPIVSSIGMEVDASMSADTATAAKNGVSKIGAPAGPWDDHTTIPGTYISRDASVLACIAFSFSGASSP